VDQQQQSRWWPTRTRILWIGISAVGLFAAIVVFGGYYFEWKWTGFPKRTPWDWVDLLIVPLVLALGGYLFNRSENRATRGAAKQRARDEALQAYLDQMGQMLLDKERPLRRSKGGDEERTLRTLARARTLTVLEVLDASRRSRVVRFLYEAQLLAYRPRNEERVVNLAYANLSDCALSGHSLPGIDLSNANLRNANLRNANLRNADLSGADLVDANLRNADLGYVDLRVANLNLRVANLRGADLRGADLSGAYLRGAKGWTEEQLTAAKSLERATMPNGQKYKDWLKSKGGGEEGENTGSS
jgi:hypothetical protein